MILRTSLAGFDARRRRRPAAGFTLVELLVAMALTLFIMVILSQAFIAGMQTFADLKAIGDMNNRLRSASATLRADLAAMWLTTGVGQPVQSLSGFRDGGNAIPAQVPTPVNGQGFFRVWQDQPHTTMSAATAGSSVITVVNITDPHTPSQWSIQANSVLIIDAGVDQFSATHVPGTLVEETVIVQSVSGLNVTLTKPLVNSHTPGTNPVSTIPVVVCEGIDTDGLISVNSANHTIHFTMDLGNLQTLDRRENYLTALISDPSPANPGSLWQYGPPAFRDATTHPYNSQWGEVVYFLRENGLSTTPDSLTAQAPMRLYSLYRRQLTAVDPSNATNPPYSALNPTTVPAPNPVPTTPNQFNYYFEMSCKPDPNTPANLYFNNPNDLTIPERRFTMNSALPITNPMPPPLTLPNGGLPLTQPNGTQPNDTYATEGIYREMSEPLGSAESQSLQGADLLLNDVISMDVQLYVPTIKKGDFSYLPTIPNQPGNNNTNPAYQGKRVFDTWSSESKSSSKPFDYSASNPPTQPWQNPPSTYVESYQTVPFSYNPIAIQVILRIWDQKTQKTRQITIIKDL